MGKTHTQVINNPLQKKFLTKS